MSLKQGSCGNAAFDDAEDWSLLWCGPLGKGSTAGFATPRPSSSKRETPSPPLRVDESDRRRASCDLRNQPPEPQTGAKTRKRAMERVTSNGGQDSFQPNGKRPVTGTAAPALPLEKDMATDELSSGARQPLLERMIARWHQRTAQPLPSHLQSTAAHEQPVDSSAAADEVSFVFSRAAKSPSTVGAEKRLEITPTTPAPLTGEQQVAECADGQDGRAKQLLEKGYAGWRETRLSMNGWHPEPRGERESTHAAPTVQQDQDDKRREKLANAEQHLRERAERIAARESALGRDEASLAERAQKLAEKEEDVAVRMQKVVDDKAAQDRWLEKQERWLQAEHELARVKELELAKQEQRLAMQKTYLDEKEQDLEQKEQDLGQKETDLTAREQELADDEAALAERWYQLQSEERDAVSMSDSESPEGEPVESEGEPVEPEREPVAPISPDYIIPCPEDWENWMVEAKETYRRMRERSV